MHISHKKRNTYMLLQCTLEDHHWSPLVSRLYVTQRAASCKFRIELHNFLNELHRSIYCDQHWHGATASRAFIVSAGCDRGHVDRHWMTTADWIFINSQMNNMNRCIFTDAIPVGLSEDQDWSQLTGRLCVSPVNCILQIQGLSPYVTAVYFRRPSLITAR